MNTRKTALAALAAMLTLSAVPLAQASPGDRDSDRMPDRWERSHGLSPRYDDSRSDRDGDGVTNYREYRSGTDPRSRDRDEARDSYQDRSHRGKDDRYRSDGRERTDDRAQADRSDDTRDDSDRD